MFQKADTQSNLVSPLSVFIGRKREIAEVKRLLGEHRLLTLTGPGGCGKTRLALQVTDQMRGDFQHGVWLVGLASLSDPAVIPQAVASALGVREFSGAKLDEVLRNTLASREALIVFDNCEHLISAVAHFVDSLLQACPALRILATSREGLGVTGEIIWPVPPLSLPSLQPWKDPAGAQETIQVYLKSESVQLFLARVQAFSPEFNVTVESAPWIAEICRRLDGMPLAIELAAARARALSIRQIAQRLDDRFNLLTSGSRTAPPRHQTLAATIDWSYALLDPLERQVLQRFSVFAGGAALDAAEAVCACPQVETGQVLNVLARLVDKSLVVADASDPAVRYHLLETIRQYARQKLVEQGDEEECRDRHLDYFLAWAEKMAAMIDGPEQLAAAQGYETEHDNLRAALGWSRFKPERGKASLRMAAACGPFWGMHSYLSEGRRQFSATLALVGTQDHSIEHARVLMYAANLAFLQSDYAAMRPLVEKAVSIWRGWHPHDRKELANSLNWLGQLDAEEGKYTSAVPHYREALEIYTQLGSKKGMGEIHMGLGWAAMRTGDYPKAETHLETFRDLAQEVGDRGGLNFALSGLGEAAVRQGEFLRATELLEHALAISHERGDKWCAGTILGSLGWIALRQGDLKRMRAILGESLDLRLEIGDRGGMAWCLEKLAEAAALENRLEEAVRMFAAAAALRRSIGSVIDLADQPSHTRRISELQARLGLDRYDACWAAGEAAPVQAVVDMALSQPVPEISRSEKERFGGLSRRERQTAVLIAQGKTNREIARALTLTEKTVETYVTRILNKLGFSSRVQVATWALDTGLLPSPNP